MKKGIKAGTIDEDIKVETVETPLSEIPAEEKKEDVKPAPKFKITREDITITTVLLSLSLLFLGKFLTYLSVTSRAVYITFFCLGCVFCGVSLFFVFIKFRREKKITFTVELVLNLIALFLWLN